MLSGYTAAQCAAIRTDGNQIIIAGPGAGKSGTVTARVVKALQSGVAPSGIVVLTYNEAASAELKQRITALAREILGEDFLGLSEIYVGTVHGYCLRLLQQDLYRYRTYAVLTDVQARLLVAHYPNASGLTSVRLLKGSKAGQGLTTEPRDVSLYLETLAVAREEQIAPEKLPEGMREALGRWHRLLDRKRLFDYSRLLDESLWALSDQTDPEHIRLQKLLADRLRLVVLDEAQDANVAMSCLLSRLHELGAHVCMCGDASQTIYQWRGADARKLLSIHKRFPNMTVHALEHNFRSSIGVVETAQAIEDGLAARLASKRMIPYSHHRFERGDILALSFPSPEAEAVWIARKICEQHGVPYQDKKDGPMRGLAFSDFAVLLRSTRKDGARVAAALKAEGIPTVMRGMTNVFDAPEAEAAAVSFEYLVGLADAEAVRVAWRCADIGVTEQDIDAGMAHLEAIRAWDDEVQGLCCLIRAYTGLLGAMDWHEERVPPTTTGEARGEVVSFNLARISQAMADYQSICYRLPTTKKFQEFARWLRTEAPGAYDQGGDDAANVTPDAVQLLTCHKAKGLEFAAVFVPALQEGRFPSHVRDWGRNKWHLLPRQVVPNSSRYDGDIDDERRLFFVAASRAAKYAYFTWSPSADDPRLSLPSRFFREVALSDWALTSEPRVSPAEKLPPQPRTQDANFVVPFTALKYWSLCPQMFRLRYLLGWQPPVAEGMGYGRSIHDACAEIRQRVREGEAIDGIDVDGIMRRHFYLPYAGREARELMLEKALRTMRRWIHFRAHTLPQVVMVEQEVEVIVGPMTVKGRIDVIRELATGEVSIGDQKTDADAQALETSRFQLYTYNLGERARVGTNVDLIEVETMTEDGSGMPYREKVDMDEMAATERRLEGAALAIQHRDLPRLKVWCTTCDRCDHPDMCPTKHLKP